MKTLEQVLNDMTPEDAYQFAIIVGDMIERGVPADQLLEVSFRRHMETKANYAEWERSRKMKK